MGVAAQPVEADADLAGYDMLVVGKGAIAADGPGPDVGRVRDGLKVIVFEQTAEVLEKRLGFRVAEYGLRQVFQPRAGSSAAGRARAGEPPRLAGRGDAAAAAAEVYDQPHLRRAGGQVVRHRSAARLAVRQSRQRGLGADREAGPRRLPADPRRRLQPAVQPADGIPRRQGAGALLPARRDGPHRAGPGRRDAGAQHPPVRRRLEAGPAAAGALRRRPGRQAASRVLGHPRERLRRAASCLPTRCSSWAAAGGRSWPPTRRPSPSSSPRAATCWPWASTRPKPTRFLPFKVTMKKAEHIAAFFEPAGHDSLLAGVGPADVHNRAPREMPLVSAGADGDRRRRAGQGPRLPTWSSASSRPTP